MRNCLPAISLILFLQTLCHADELTFPGGLSVERDRPVTVIYKTGLQATGKGELRVHWTDAYGRVVEDRTIPVELTDENQVRFPIDLRRAVAMQNQLQVHLSFQGLDKKGVADHREEDVAVSFIARPAGADWSDYMIIMWQDGSAAQFLQLQQAGINAGKSAEHSNQLPEPLLKDDLRWYVENMATDFYSAYHIYKPDRPYNAALLQSKELYRKDPLSKEGLKRHPSFSDPAWLTMIHDRLVESARLFAPYRPIFYNLADESGIAELAGFWDFDFSDHSLDAMRNWLKDRYGTLASLNKQWGSSFSQWDSVTPETTREAMKRTDENYSSWADFKEWMDVSFANALKLGADAIHSVDPHAYVGIEGAQMPGWGGYDYARLTSVLDAMEPYDIGANIEIIRSLNPKLAFVTTAFATGPLEKHRVWYELLHGARGHIIWDEKHDIIEPGGTLGARGREVAPYWNELRGGIGALLINSIRESGPIAIHYSQASMRTEWMLAQRAKGDAWMERMSWTERKDSDFLRLRDSYCRLIEDHGLQYNFVSYAQVEQGELLRRGYRILILPRSSALSQAEAAAILEFVRQGGSVVIDGDAGSFDEHSRRLPASSLSPVFAGQTGRGTITRLDALDYAKQRILDSSAPVYDAMTRVFRDAHVHAGFSVTDQRGAPVTGIETHVFRNGGVFIVGLLSNPPVEVNELGTLQSKAEQRFSSPKTVRLSVPEELYAYDIRRAKPLGRLRQMTLTIDPYEPSIIAFSPTALPRLVLSAPQRAARGTNANIGAALDGHFPGQTAVFHIDVRDPSGTPVPRYSGNVLAPGGAAEKLVPLAVNDATGLWTIQVKDLLSGQTREAAIDVF